MSEADDVFDSLQKQAFIYDDFLGQTSLHGKLNKNEDQRLLRFLDTVRSSPRARLILTTREYILNQAKQIYEPPARAPIEVSKCTIDLSKYTRFQRAKILFNHLYFSKLLQSWKQALLEDRKYLQIIDHRNFSPRVIEWMCDSLWTAHLREGEFVRAFFDALDKPFTIWEHAFEQQISEEARCLLLTLWSMTEEAFLDDVERAYAALLRLRAKRYSNAVSMDAFRKALKVTEGTFTHTFRVRQDNLVRFHNPSIRDFLSAWLEQHVSELIDTCDSATWFEQASQVANWLTDREGLRQHAAVEDSVRAAMSKTFNEPTARLIDTYVKYSARERSEPYKSRWDLGPWQRTAELLEAAESFGGGRWKTLLMGLLNQLAEIEITSNRRDTAVALCKRLLVARTLSAQDQERIVKAIARRCMRGPSTIYDFEAAVRCMKDLQQYVRQTDIEDLRSGFLIFYPSSIRTEIDNADDPDWLRSYADSLRSIASCLDIDVEEEAQELQELAEEIEKEIPPEPDMDDDDWRSAPADRGGGGDIDLLFEHLKP